MYYLTFCLTWGGPSYNLASYENIEEAFAEADRLNQSKNSPYYLVTVSTAPVPIPNY